MELQDFRGKTVKDAGPSTPVNVTGFKELPQFGLYVRNFKVSDTSFDPLKFVLARISRLIRAELNDEPFSPELLLCVKVHLWRRVRYGTRIPITQAQIDSSLRK